MEDRGIMLLDEQQWNMLRVASPRMPEWGAVSKLKNRAAATTWAWESPKRLRDPQTVIAYLEAELLACDSIEVTEAVARIRSILQMTLQFPEYPAEVLTPAPLIAENMYLNAPSKHTTWAAMSLNPHGVLLGERFVLCFASPSGPA